MRSVDFQTGEATIHQTDNSGVFERRLFVSRVDGIAVMLIKGPDKGTVNCRLKLKPRVPSQNLGPRTLESSSRRDLPNRYFEYLKFIDGIDIAYINDCINASSQWGEDRGSTSKQYERVSR